MSHKLLSLTGVAAVLLAASLVPLLDSNNAPTTSASKARAKTAVGDLPLYFVENQGQSDSKVDFYVPGQTSIFFTSRGVTYSLGDEQSRWAVRQSFLGANRAEPQGLDRTGAVFSYFKGDRVDWQTGVASFSGMAYRDLWPGIDLVYRGGTGQLKYSFVVQPGADPSDIRLAYRGATDLQMGPDGGLRVSAGSHGFTDQAPYVYQGDGASRVEVDSAYHLAGSSYGFGLGSYDLSRPLVIDPAVTVWAGYIGGDSQDGGNGIAVDASGNAYVVGTTYSSEATFPEVVGPDSSYTSGGDAFVAKVAADGTGLMYAGYIGGQFDEEGTGIAVDGAGNAYVIGDTRSGRKTFPDTVGRTPRSTESATPSWPRSMPPAPTWYTRDTSGGRGLR
jgi:hypothetical protein